MSTSSDNTKQHGVFYYVFFGILSILATVFILGAGCIILGVGIPAFLSAKHRAAENGTAKTDNAAPTNNPESAPALAVISKQSYIDQSIQVYGFVGKYYSSYGGRKAGLEFKIKNNGEKVLTTVEITIYFPDAAGNTIAEEKFYPVFESRITSDSRPLKPGYIWQLDDGQYYPAKNIPDEWFPARTHYKITDIEFEKEE